MPLTPLYNSAGSQSVSAKKMAYARNGCEKFACKPAEGLVKPFRTHPQNVAAIDFGTANCSLMYLLAVNKMKDPAKVEPVRLKLDGHFRVPNCALFDKRGKMIAFGLYAQRLYYKSTKRQDLKDVFFFQRIKMQLQHDKTVSRKTVVKAVNGAEFYLVDVIAHILNWMKEKLLEQEARLKVKATDFDWVITVPAIWQARGKQMMREAGYKAGLCTIRKPQPLCQACDIEPQMIEEPNPDRLTLALEPECATAHCRQAGGFQGEENYLLVDIGGGTVDIVSHAIVAGHLEEIIPPQGNAWGGTTINENFREFLGRTLGDPSFFRYTGPHIEEEIRSSNKRDLDYIVNKEFEEIKRDFGAHYNGEQGPDSFAIQLPPSFWDNYKGNMKTTGREGGISFDMHTHELTLSRSKMVELFAPTIKGIVSIVKKVLQEVGETIENVYLAGGFGGCHYVKMKLQTVLTEMQQDFLLHPAPGEAELGIVHGAVMFRCDPTIIHKRKADATYGVNVGIRFKPGVHDETKKIWNEDQQEYKCSGIFCTIVEKGDSISSGTVYVTDVGTSRKDTRSIFMNVYSSPQTDVWYITDPDVQCLGHFELSVSGYGLHRKIEVAVDFTHAEIQLRAYDKQNPDNEVKLALDFLCNN